MSELIGRSVASVHRRVGIEVPEGRSAVGIGMDMLRNLGIDLELADRTLYVDCGQAEALYLQGALERRSGLPAFNEWLA